MLLEFKVYNDEIYCLNATSITSDTEHTAKFKFSDASWSGYGIIAVFSNSRSDVATEVALDGSFTCTVPILPVSFTKDPCNLVVSLKGIVNDTTEKRTYQPCKIKLNPADNLANYICNDSTPLPASLSEQFSTLASNSLATLEQLKSADYATTGYVQNYVYSHGGVDYGTYMTAFQDSLNSLSSNFSNQASKLTTIDGELTTLDTRIDNNTDSIVALANGKANAVHNHSIAELPTGTTSTSLALGNHTHESVIDDSTTSASKVYSSTKVDTLLSGKVDTSTATSIQSQISTLTSTIADKTNELESTITDFVNSELSSETVQTALTNGIQTAITDGLLDTITPEMTTFSKTSDNIFNKNLVIDGYTYSFGVLTQNVDYCASGLQPCASSVKYYQPYTIGTVYVNFYDSSKTYLSRTTLNLSNGFTTPSNCVYLSFGVIKTSAFNKDTFMLTPYPCTSIDYMPHSIISIEAKSISDFEAESKSMIEKYAYDNTTIDFWGDSLQGGESDNIATYVLNALGSDFNCNHLGYGGDTVPTIAGRQGGVPWVTNGTFTIPADLTAVEIPMKSLYGNVINAQFTFNRGVNPVVINGVNGVLSSPDVLDRSKFTFTRSVVGSAITIDRPTIVETNAMHNNRNNVMVMCIGTNGGFTDLDQLILYIKNMIEFNINKNYIICGIYTATSITDNYDARMLKEFGIHFISTRDYLVNYAMSDLGLTPTDTDLQYLSLGKVPPSLLSDSIHWTSDARHSFCDKVLIPRIKLLLNL